MAGGYRVVVSRTRNSTVARLRRGDERGGLLTATGVHADIAAHDVCANKAGADILAGIDMNAGAAGAVGSLTAYDAARPFAAQNRRLAAVLQRNVLGRLNAAGSTRPASRYPMTGSCPTAGSAHRYQPPITLTGAAIPAAMMCCPRAETGPGQAGR